MSMDNINLQVGDLVMCRVKVDPDEKEDIIKNYKLVIGWITGKELNGYYVHWSDKDKSSLINVESTVLIRKLFIEQRKAMGI